MIPLGVLAGSRHVATGGATSIAPNEFADLNIWLDSLTLSGADASDVTSWDSSGTSYNYTSRVGLAAPKLTLNHTNPAVRFTGAEVLVDVGGKQGVGGPQTFFVVGTKASSLSKRIVGVAGTGLVLTIDAQQNPVGGVYGGNWATAESPESVPLNTLFLAGVRFVPSTSLEVFYNGVWTLGATPTTLSNDRAFAVGGYAATTPEWIGDIGEFVHVRKALDATEAEGLVSYLENKWGI
jgi:hypothetical protein